MNKAADAGMELNSIDDLAQQDSPLHHASPLAKLLLAVLYILTVVSFNKYDITGLIFMILFPIFGYQLSFIPVKTCFKKLRIVMPLVCAVGLLNPFFDKQILAHIGNVAVSGGVISMLTLMMKGIFCLMASFLLAATTSIDKICYALRRLHFPKMLTSLLLLTFRYIGVLLDEVSVMTEAYQLRAPGQKGIHISAWGSFLGQLILRSMDRADALYESMLLRGFKEEFYYADTVKASDFSWFAACICAALIIVSRIYNIPLLLGSLFV